MLTDQQIDEFLEMLAKSPTSARDMVRGLFAKAAPAVPFDERKAFEREMRSRHGWNNSYFTQSNDGGYLSNRATYAYIGWQARAAIEKSAAKEPAVPQGWKLVPVEPTEEMLAAVSWPGCARTEVANIAFDYAEAMLEVRNERQ